MQFFVSFTLFLSILGFCIADSLDLWFDGHWDTRLGMGIFKPGEQITIVGILQRYDHTAKMYFPMYISSTCWTDSQGFVVNQNIIEIVKSQTFIVNELVIDVAQNSTVRTKNDDRIHFNHTVQIPAANHCTFSARAKVARYGPDPLPIPDYNFEEQAKFDVLIQEESKLAYVYLCFSIALVLIALRCIQLERRNRRLSSIFITDNKSGKV